VTRAFSAFATWVAHAAGRPAAFVAAVVLVVAWACLGPVFDYSEAWQLVINTGTTIITFIMVFVLQASQNRDGAAIQAKLDELIAASAGRDALIGAESLTEDELDAIRERPKC
jgi:low affinity Fe/Cu permease